MLPALLSLRSFAASSSGLSGGGVGPPGIAGVVERLGSKFVQPAMAGAQNSPKRAAGRSQRAPPGSATRAPVTLLMTENDAQLRGIPGAWGRSAQLAASEPSARTTGAGLPAPSRRVLSVVLHSRF